MSIAGRIAWDDTILPFQLDRADIRGRVARLDTVLETILSQHDYPAPVAALVAEATLLTALIGQTIKLRWKLSLQVRGEGPVRLIATDYFGPAEEGTPAKMRAYAGYDAAALDGAGGCAVRPDRRRLLRILIDQGRARCPTRASRRSPGARSPIARRPTSPSPSSCRPASRSPWARVGRPAARRAGARAG
jgi:molecular chaperone Hsp33